MPRRKPLVMHVVEAFGGGTFESTRQLVHHTAPYVQTLVVHGTRAETPGDFHDLFPRGTRFVPLTMGRAINPKADLSATLALRNLIKAERPLVVHGHSTKGGAIARLACLGLPPKLVYSPRGYAFLMDDTSPPKRALYLALELILAHLPGVTHACGYDEGKTAGRLGRSVVIPNAIDTAAIVFHPRAYKGGKQVLRVIAGGRVSHQKGFDRFLATARLCRGLPIHFTWLGGGDGLPADLPPNLTVTGWLPQAGFLKNCLKAHVFLSLSRWEGLPRGVLEAMATGMPVLLSPINGHIELVPPPPAPPTGALTATPKNAAARLKALLETPTDVARLSRNARALIEDRYDIARTIPQILKLYGVA
jgi:glycosyltransferase involved in cell wall biosynthesis